ncbi:MAG: glycosyltransferase family 4 protein [Candidatus Aenigmarchaeota archaeon]|nr:glycosyltransferase family 4 protein [Candidatus Aenigmarchaeota archaeon]
MRIALVSSNSFHSYGGIQNHVLGLYNYLKSKGHYVKIISPKFKNERPVNHDHIFVGQSTKISMNGGLTDFTILTKKDNLKQLFENEKFDIIHIHNPNLMISLQILANSNSKNIITFHVLPDQSSLYGIFKRVIKGLKKIKIYKKINGVIYVSKPVKKYFARYFRFKSQIIPNGIEIERFNSNEKIEKFNDGKINLLFLSRIEKRKGLIYLIKAFEILRKKNDKIRLIVAGTGNLEKACKKYVQKRKIPDVEFVGSISDEDKIKYYNTCDIFCAPSIFGESFGIVLIEAMASGKPIVGFANKGYKTLLSGKAGKFLAKPKNHNSLARKINILLKNKELREEIGKWGKEEVKNYSWNVVGEKIENFYRSVLNEK